MDQLSRWLPPAQCSRDGGHSPPHSQPHGPSPDLTAGTPCRASCQRSRGRSDTRSSSSSRGAPGRSGPWPCRGRCPSRSGCCCARGRLGDEEEETAESERGEAAWRCLIREICASWARTRPASGEETGGGGPENRRAKSYGGMMVPCSLRPTPAQPLSLPDPIDTKTHHCSGPYGVAPCRTVPTSRNVPLLRPRLFPRGTSTG